MTSDTTAGDASEPDSPGSRVDQVLLAEPRGFCAGVEMAIKALAWMVRSFPAPVYCYHEIVHNRLVVQRFEQLGVVFVDDIADIPPGMPIMLSAHGSAPEVVAAARARGAYVVDSVCPSSPRSTTRSRCAPARAIGSSTSATKGTRRRSARWRSRPTRSTGCSRSPRSTRSTRSTSRSHSWPRRRCRTATGTMWRWRSSVVSRRCGRPGAATSASPPPTARRR